MKNRHQRIHAKQSGHVSTEWILIVIMLFVVLFVPLNGKGKSLSSYFMDGIRDYHKNSSYIYSLP